MEEGFRETQRASNADVTELHTPHEREPVALWLIVLIMALTFFAGMFLWANSGGFQHDIYNTDKISWSGAGAGGPAAPPDPMVVGKRVFSQNCAVCHQADGMGVSGQFPPLAGSEWVMAEDWCADNHLARIVLHGLEGTVTVKGQQFNNAMAPWGGVLKDEQIAAVLTYVRNEWGNKAPPFPVEFVTKIRTETKDRSTPWTQKELQAVGKEMAADTAPAPVPAPATAPAASPAPSPGA
jgi:mono/diheme cytochrome c family protein